jgi:cytidine deaminase
MRRNAEMNLVDLVQMAREVQKMAYSPYSGFSVGAALLTEEGHIYTGANVENASYGLTICAERVALFKAVTAGERRFYSIAIAGSGLDYIYPCGACLQVLAEFSADIKIIVVNKNDDFKEYHLGEMLPQIFSLDTSSRRVK